MDDGYHTIIFDNGDRFEGNFKNGVKNGHGVFTWKSDRKSGSHSIRYEGEYKDGKSDGLGLLIFKDGTIFQGEFKDGTQKGKGVKILRNGKKIVKQIGNFQDLILNGDGITIDDDLIFQGEFKDGKRIGKGRFSGITRGAKRIVIVGFKDNRIDGTMRVLGEDGTLEIDCEWKSGKPVRGTLIDYRKSNPENQSNLDTKIESFGDLNYWIDEDEYYYHQ